MLLIQGIMNQQLFSEKLPIQKNCAIRINCWIQVELSIQLFLPLLKRIVNHQFEKFLNGHNPSFDTNGRRKRNRVDWRNKFPVAYVEMESTSTFGLRVLLLTPLTAERSDLDLTNKAKTKLILSSDISHCMYICVPAHWRRRWGLRATVELARFVPAGLPVAALRGVPRPRPLQLLHHLLLILGRIMQSLTPSKVWTF